MWLVASGACGRLVQTDPFGLDLEPLDVQLGIRRADADPARREWQGVARIEEGPTVDFDRDGAAARMDAELVGRRRADLHRLRCEHLFVVCVPREYDAVAVALHRLSEQEVDAQPGVIALAAFGELGRPQQEVCVRGPSSNATATVAVRVKSSPTYCRRAGACRSRRAARLRRMP